MLQWFQRLLPRQNVFFPAFERHAAVMVKTALALREMVNDGDEPKPRFQEILALEHEADAIAREVLLGLRTTFIPPFDRADIQSLITSMGDSVDECKATAKAIMLFEIRYRSHPMMLIGDEPQSYRITATKPYGALPTAALAVAGSHRPGDPSQ